MKLLIVQTAAMLAGAPVPASSAPALTELNDARSAFGQCMQHQIVKANPTAAPEAIAGTAFAACQPQQARLRLALAATQSGSAERQAEALRKFDEGIAASRVQVADYIRTFRKGAAAHGN